MLLMDYKLIALDPASGKCFEVNSEDQTSHTFFDDTISHSLLKC